MWVLQFSVLGILTLVVFYGLSFIVNMIFHRWWANLIAYLLFLIYVFLHLDRMNVILWVIVVLSLLAVVIAAWNVRQLRDRGYQMFQQKPPSSK